MRRRARWLAIGAAIGIAGYRRLARHASSLAGQPAAAPARAPRRLRSALAATARVIGLPRAGEIPAFVRDVRLGMVEYQREHRGNIARQHGRSGNTLVSQRAGSNEQPSRGRALGGAAPRGSIWGSDPPASARNAVGVLGAGGERADGRPVADRRERGGEATGGDGLTSANGLGGRRGRLPS